MYGTYTYIHCNTLQRTYALQRYTILWVFATVQIWACALFTGLFSCVHISFHVYTSLCICTGIFLFLQIFSRLHKSLSCGYVSFHMYRSLFMRTRLFACVTGFSCPFHMDSATRCNALQRASTYCITPQHTATHCSTLQHTAAHRNTLQHTATQCVRRNRFEVTV